MKANRIKVFSSRHIENGELNFLGKYDPNEIRAHDLVIWRRVI